MFCLPIIAIAAAAAAPVIFADIVSGEHHWHERVCVSGSVYRDGSEERCRVVHVKESNVSEAVEALLNDVCSPGKCNKRVRYALESKIKWGNRIIDADWEILRRRDEGHRFTASIEALMEEGESDLCLVQIGANVGAVVNDPVFPVLRTHASKLRGLLFEPLLVQQQELEKNYAPEIHGGSVVTVQAAICNEEGQATFWESIPPDSDRKRLYDFLYRTHSAQMGALAATGRTGAGDYSYEGTAWRQVEVACISPSSVVGMVKEHFGASAEIDILVIDAEGYDIDLVLDFLEFLRPRIILFEHVEFSEEKLQRVMLALDKATYICKQHSMMDTLCSFAGPRSKASALESMCDDCTSAMREANIADAEYSIEISVDGVPRTVVANLDMHPANMAHFACLSLRIQMKGCDQLAKHAADLWQERWKKVFLDGF